MLTITYGQVNHISSLEGGIGDMMSYIIRRGRRCDITVLNGHALKIKAVI